MGAAAPGQATRTFGPQSECRSPSRAPLVLKAEAGVGWPACPAEKAALTLGGCPRLSLSS